MYALDTESLLGFFEGKGRIGERLLRTPPGEIMLPSLVLYEVEMHLAKHPDAEARRAELNRLVSHLRVLPLGPEEVRMAGLVHQDLEDRGFPLGPHSDLIAGTAMSHGAVLVTPAATRLSNIKGLLAEDWR